jgi:Tfp pilus assembly protein PilF
MKIDKAFESAVEKYLGGNLKQAEILCKKSIKKNPTHSKAFYLLGTIYLKLKEYDIAIEYFSNALQSDNNNSDIYFNLGFVYTEKGHHDEAIKYYKKALQINPDNSDVCNNIGMALLEKGKPKESLNYFQKTLEMNPALVDAHANMSLAFLLLGNFEQGWKEYEWRLKSRDYVGRTFSRPLWDGSDISGKIILIHTEQGLGDAIQFIRYIPFVVEHEATIIVECQKELVTLFQNITGIKQVVARGKPLLHFDFHCPLLSLPLIHGTTLETIPVDIPYITANASSIQEWKNKVNNNSSKLTIGLVWAGSPTLKRSHLKECPLKMFFPLTHNEDITFYSLQKGKAAEQANSPPDGMNLIDNTDEFHDFLDTAAFIENLDLVISIDTAVAHLAGAMGKPVWTLLPFVPDWRWMLNRKDSPWYPTMRLFRQPSPGDWKSVINNVRKELEKVIRDETFMSKRDTKDKENQ